MKNNRKKFIVMAIVAMMFSLEASAQVYSSGGGDSTDYKSTIGYLNTATGKYSLAAGSWCEASGQSSIALGYNSNSFGLCSMALGMYVESHSNYGITIGRGHSSYEPLINNTKGIMMGMGSDVPTLFISYNGFNYATGRVGIGNVTDPQAKLHIRSNIDEDVGIILEPGQMQTGNAFIQFRDENHKISVGTNGAMSITAGAKPLSLEGSRVSLTGKVGINTVNTNTGYALAVSGGILTDQVLIRDVSDWPDYVFGKGHALMSLNNVKTFIDKNHHLPDVPSAQEVEENGVNVAEMQKVLLKKIEELTLYTIEQQRLIEELQEKIERLENQ